MAGEIDIMIDIAENAGVRKLYVFNSYRTDNENLELSPFINQNFSKRQGNWEYGKLHFAGDYWYTDEVNLILKLKRNIKYKILINK